MSLSLDEPLAVSDPDGSLAHARAPPGDLALTIRTTRTTVSFANPFCLWSLNGALPAGDYVVVNEDETIEGLSRAAYRRVATHFTTPAISATVPARRSFLISQTDLDAALMKDRHQTIERR